MGLRRGAAWLLGLVGAMPAWAGSFYLESAPVASRDAAAAIGQQLGQLGVEGDILRLYVRETGWRYVFRSQERSQPEGLSDALLKLQPAGIPVHLVSADDGRVELVSTSAVAPTLPAARPPTDPTVPPATPASPPLGEELAFEAQEILRRVVRAHAGPVAGSGLATARALLFRFRRSLPGLEVVHTYARKGDDLFVEVDVEAGEGQDSRSGVVKGVAWTDAPGAGTLDPLFVRDVLRRFSPEWVFGLAGLLTSGSPPGREYDEMAVGESARVDGRAAVSLEFRGDREAAPRTLLIDLTTWTVSEVLQGGLRWRFYDYFEVGDGSIVPRRVEVWRDRSLVDAIEVIDLDRGAAFPPEWFPVVAR